MKNLFLVCLLILGLGRVGNAQCNTPEVMYYPHLDCFFSCPFECDGTIDYWCYKRTINDFYTECEALNQMYQGEANYILNDAGTRRAYAFTVYANCLQQQDTSHCLSQYCSRLTRINTQAQTDLDELHATYTAAVASLNAAKCAELQTCCITEK